MFRRILFATLTVAALAAVPALAQCSAAAKEDKGCAGRLEQAAKAEQGCGGQQSACCGASDKPGGCDSPTCTASLAAFKGLNVPRLMYQVGDSRVPCRTTARKLAAEQQTQIRFVLNDKVYADEAEAYEAYAQQLEQLLDDLLTVKYAVGDTCTGCKVSAEKLARQCGKPVRYRVGTFEFADREAAERAVEAARKAAAKLQMKVLVGDKPYDCPTHARQAAEHQRKPVEFCVGKNKTRCQATAKLRLAMERIRAALTTCAENGGQPISDV